MPTLNELERQQDELTARSERLAKEAKDAGWQLEEARRKYDAAAAKGHDLKAPGAEFDRLETLHARLLAESREASDTSDQARKEYWTALTDSMNEEQLEDMLELLQVKLKNI